MNAPTSGGEAPGVGVRTITVGGLPLLVAAAADHGPAAAFLATVASRGLRPLPAFSGVELPRGAELGFVVDVDELRLVDPDDRTILRAARAGLDADWLEVSKRLRGTMTVVVRDLEIDGDSTPIDLVAAVDAAAADGRALGAIVGLVEERPTLPLLLG